MAILILFVIQVLYTRCSIIFHALPRIFILIPSLFPGELIYLTAPLRHFGLYVDEDVAFYMPWPYDFFTV